MFKVEEQRMESSTRRASVGDTICIQQSPHQKGLCSRSLSLQLPPFLTLFGRFWSFLRQLPRSLHSWQLTHFTNYSPCFIRILPSFLLCTFWSRPPITPCSTYAHAFPASFCLKVLHEPLRMFEVRPLKSFSVKVIWNRQEIMSSLRGVAVMRELAEVVSFHPDYMRCTVLKPNQALGVLIVSWRVTQVFLPRIPGHIFPRKDPQVCVPMRSSSFGLSQHSALQVIDVALPSGSTTRAKVLRLAGAARTFECLGTSSLLQYIEFIAPYTPKCPRADLWTSQDQIFFPWNPNKKLRTVYLWYSFRFQS